MKKKMKIMKGGNFDENYQNKKEPSRKEAL